MKYSKITWVIFLMFITVLCVGPATADDLSSKKVVVISGVSEASAEGIGYNLVYDGINEGFKAAGVKPVYQWVEMDSLPNDEAKEAAGKEAIAKARAENPDLIITLNDDALKFIGSRIDDIPVVFAWIFGSPSKLGMPKDNVTGVLRTSYAADIWTLAKKLLPKADTVALISKKSASMGGIRKILFGRAPLLKKASGVEFKEMYLVDTFDEWKKTVDEFPEDFIYLADTSRIKKGDKTLSRTETTAWTVDNAKVPVIAAAQGDVKAGALFSIVTSEHGIGLTASEVALRVLNGEPPPQVYKQSKKGKLLFNLKTANKYKIEIPFDLLSSADKVYE